MPQLPQPLRLGSGPVLVGELGVGLAPPERQGVAQASAAAPGASSRPRLARASATGLEAGDVEGLVGSWSM